MASRPLLHGVVTAFDDEAGTGVVRAEGGDEHGFHCTALTDGTRTIEVGAEVAFVVVPGRAGRWEATRIRRR